MADLLSRSPARRLGATIVGILATAACSMGIAGVESANAAVSPTASPEPASLLFVQTASAGRVSRNARGQLVLALRTSRWTQSFTDRPRRVARSERTRFFVNAWRKRGFATDPPNAALSIDKANPDVISLELRRPRYRDGWLRYTVKPLKGSRAPRLGRFGTASLFIDNALAGWCFNLETGNPCNEYVSKMVVFTVPPNFYGSFAVTLQSSVAVFSTQQPSGGYTGVTYDSPTQVTVSVGADFPYDSVANVPVTIQSNSPFGVEDGPFTLTSSLQAQIYLNGTEQRSPIGPDTPVTYTLD